MFRTAETCSTGDAANTIAVVQAAECISRGLEKYANGDRMGALKFFEESLQKVPSGCNTNHLPDECMPAYAMVSSHLARH